MRKTGELVLIHYEGRPALYARLERVEPDVKKDWYRATLLLLSIPARAVTWILREPYIDGAPFTMGGKDMRIDSVDFPGRTHGEGTDGPEKRKPSDKPGTVVPFRSRR